MTIQQFVEELQRRHVFKVVGGYLVASWVAIEVSNTIFQILALVDAQKYSRYVLIACAVGLPFAFVLAWMFDFTKEGIVRTPRWVPPEERDAAVAPDGRPVAAAPHRGVVLSARASGMFGLGVIVAIVSLAAYTRVVHTPEATSASSDSALAKVSAIAVMPFEDISEKHDQKYFADGMTEELLSRLAQVENLQIVSGEGYATPTRGGDLQSVATRLNVQAVLQGSVARAQDSVRVSVKLINPSSNKVLYVQTFTRPTSNIFQVQDEIAEAVAGSLKLQTTADVAKGAGDLETTNPEAFALYAKGLQSLDARTEPELRKAIEYFDSASKLDQKWAKPYAGLAQTYAVLPTISRMSFEEAGTKGNSAAATAIAADPNLPEAYAALGQIAQNISWNLHMAENFYERAIKDRGSKYAPGHQWYAETLAMLGRTDEALKEINTAIQLKPGSAASKNTLGYVLTIRGDLDSALSVFRTEGSLYPEYKLGHLTHALTAMTAGKYDEALQAAQNYAGTDASMANTMSTVIRGAAGTVPRAEAVRAAASLEPRLGAGFTALWFGALKDKANAMKMVQKAYDAGKDANFPYFVIHPLLGILKDDPAYKKIVEDMGVVPAR